MNTVLAIVLATMAATSSQASAPFAVAETAPGAVCIITQQQLKAGEPVIIVLFDPERFITGHVMTSLSRPCGGDPYDVGPHGRIYSITPPAKVVLDYGVGIGITSAAATASMDSGRVEVRNVLEKGDLVRFKQCASHEGLHLTAWNGKARIWHEYYYLPYGADPTCTEAETSEPTPPN